MWILGRPNVEKMKAKENVNGLIKALGYEKHWEVRVQAARALGEIGDPRGVDPLIAALRDEYGWVRKAAASALGQIGDPRAVEPLGNALEHTYGWVRKAAGSPDQAPRGSVQPDPVGSRHVAVPMREARLSAVAALGLLGDPRAVEPLIFALNDRHPDVRMAAAEALGAIGDPRAVEPLVGALSDPYVRHTAARMLGQMSALQDEDPAVRAAVGQVLDQMRDSRESRPPTAMRRHDDQVVRKASEAVDQFSRKSIRAERLQTVVALSVLAASLACTIVFIAVGDCTGPQNPAGPLSNPFRGCDTFDREDGRATYQYDSLVIRDCTGPQYRTVSLCRGVYVEDAVVEVDMTWIDGPDENWQGVLVRWDDVDSGYSFDISSDGWYIIAIHVEGAPEALVGPTRSHHIRTDLGAVNSVRASAIGSTLRLSINGHLVAEATDTSLQGGSIGLSVGSTADEYSEVTFTNLVVTEPD